MVLGVLFSISYNACATVPLTEILQEWYGTKRNEWRTHPTALLTVLEFENAW